MSDSQTCTREKRPFRPLKRSTNTLAIKVHFIGCPWWHYSSFSFFLFSLLFPSVDPLYSYPLNQVVPVKAENNIHYYNHLCLILSQMYNLKVIEHYELVHLQYVIHCKNTKLSMRIYKHHQGSTRIYKLYNFPPPKSLFK